MAGVRFQLTRTPISYLSTQSFLLRQPAFHWRPRWPRQRPFASQATSENASSKHSSSSSGTSSTEASSIADTQPESTSDTDNSSLPPGWENIGDTDIEKFSQLPHEHFGFNQHMVINAEFKEALRQVLWQFRAPIRYAFAYGSGVFPQSSPLKSSASAPQVHPNPPKAITKWQTSGQKNIDFIFGVSFTQHWHSINLQEHRDHYSFLASFGSGLVSRIQDRYGAGAYFHPYIVINGLMIKYGVVNLDTLYRDLSEWNTMYLAGRLQKPVKILRDDPRIRLANQINLISALRTALLMLPADFTENQLYCKIASISYMGDPRMAFRAESPRKVQNIVDNQMTNFRQLYLPLIDDLPNVSFNDAHTSKQDWTGDPSLDCKIQQDMDPIRRGNMVRRLPKHFRRRLYDTYQRVFRIPSQEYRDILEESKDENTFSKTQGSDFDRRIAGDPDLDQKVAEVFKSIINGPSLKEAIKAVLTAGVSKSWRYVGEKRAKGRERSVAKSPDKDETKQTLNESGQQPAAEKNEKTNAATSAQASSRDSSRSEKEEQAPTEQKRSSNAMSN